jgi:hypothetical protein
MPHLPHNRKSCRAGAVGAGVTAVVIAAAV